MSSRCPDVAAFHPDEPVWQQTLALAPQQSVTLTLRRQQRRTLAIQVHRNATVEVRAPMFCPHETVMQFVNRRRHWIRRQLERVAASAPACTPRYTQGESHRYLGEEVVLALQQGTPAHGELVQGQLRLRLNRPDDPKRVKGVLEQWYRIRAAEVFSGRLAHWFDHHAYRGLRQPRLRLRRMRRRWGSCSTQAVITLNTRLIEQRLQLIDFVVVHELCHLRVFDHSARFHALMDAVLPDWRRRRLALEQAG